MAKIIHIITIFFLTVSLGFSQSYLGKQKSFDLGTDEMMRIYTGEPDLQKMAAYFFGLGFEKVLKEAKAKGIKTALEEGTIYIDGKKVRFDLTEDGMKQSHIMNFESRKMYSVMWDKKEYIEMDLDEIQAMQKNVQKTMTSQMEQMKDVMDKLPPEAKAKMAEYYGASKSSPAQVEATGKKETINGFKCSEYIVTKDNKSEQIWATSDYADVREAFKEFEESMPDMKGGDNSVWEKINGWPVRQTEVEANKMTMQGGYKFSEVHSLEKTTHKADTFIPPKNFKRKSMSDMMKDNNF